jgi:hypothetical protein
LALLAQVHQLMALAAMVAHPTLAPSQQLAATALLALQSLLAVLQALVA